MAKQAEDQVSLPAHGASVLPDVRVEGYNAEIEDKDGFVGDRASKGAFSEILEKWRSQLRKLELDPLGKTPSDEVGKRKLESLLEKGSPAEAGLVQSAIEDFAQQLASVVRRFMRLKEWRDCERIAIGGGFQASRIGATAVGRAALLLKDGGLSVDIDVIHNDPDHAGLIGTAYLLPPWMLKGHEAMLALDIGGTNIRAGVVDFKLKKSIRLADAEVSKLEHWRHADDQPDRETVVKRIVAMLKSLAAWAEKNNKNLAPVVGIGCPGVIEDDGTISRGAQNLPGNWESSKFNLPNSIRENFGWIGKHEAIAIMHNDAVVQGLSEIPYYRDCERWGVLTIGTGLGNAVYSNRKPEKAKDAKSNRESQAT